jgi:hypothetical protein
MQAVGAANVCFAYALVHAVDRRPKDRPIGRIDAYDIYAMAPIAIEAVMAVRTVS